MHQRRHLRSSNYASGKLGTDTLLKKGAVKGAGAIADNIVSTGLSGGGSTLTNTSTSHRSESEVTARESRLRFGKTARLNSAADLDIEASQVAGRDGVLLEAGGNIAVTSRAETKSLHVGSAKTTSVIPTRSDASGVDEMTQKASELVSEGDIVVKSDGGIHLQASDVRSDESISLTAKDRVVLDSATERSTKSEAHSKLVLMVLRFHTPVPVSVSV